MSNVHVEKEFLIKAAEYLPALYEKEYKKYRILDNFETKELYPTSEKNLTDDIGGRDFRTGDSIILDFLTHHVGYFEFSVDLSRGFFDAPLFLKVSFGENLNDFKEDFKNYTGGLSAGWLQQEYLHMDDIPARISMPRRYAFRYVKIDVIATSNAYYCSFSDLKVKAVSSADVNKLKKYEIKEKFRKIDEIAVKTLHDCMQLVFEDGPKRDQRLWVGDLRLQALVNYCTFDNDELVKRCLYLFAGIRREDGGVFGCLCKKVETEAENLYLSDYALLYSSCVYDYYVKSKDKKVLCDLWDVAFRQAEIVMENTDENGLIKDKPGEWWSFIDWQKKLNKQAPTQGVLIYVLKQLKILAAELCDEKRENTIDKWLDKAINGAMLLWDGKQQFFVSGEKREVFAATQIWMILAGVLSEEQNAKIIDRLFENNMTDEIKTPYLIHYLLEAMYSNGREKEAEEFMLEYWGEMADKGTDCFWEAYEKGNDDFSPYSSPSINSYCHAWSCTPSYFIRKNSKEVKK